MKNISSFLAIRYLFGSSYEKSISTMTVISFTSIIVATFSLALVTAIMQGFETETHQKMQSIHAQASIQAGGETINTEAISAVIAKEFPEITGISPHSHAYVILQSPDQEQQPMVTMLKSIEPEQENKVSSIGKKLYNTTSLSDAIHHNNIVIGKTLAHNMGFTKGMPITLMYLDPTSGKRKVSIHKTEAIVNGMFDTGIDEFDTGLVLCTPQFLHSLFPDNGITEISIALDKNVNEEYTLSRLKNRIGLDVFSWKDRYPALVSALKLEKYAMFFILVLITLVASMNIIALLFMIIRTKHADIAILRSMGASSRLIVHLFMMVGIMLSAIASSIGVALAWLASWFLDRYPFIELPDIYYITHLPVKMDWHITILVLLVTMLITILATWWTARQTRLISIANVLRFEG